MILSGDGQQLVSINHIVSFLASNTTYCVCLQLFANYQALIFKSLHHRIFKAYFSNRKDEIIMCLFIGRDRPPHK